MITIGDEGLGYLWQLLGAFGGAAVSGGIAIWIYWKSDRRQQREKLRGDKGSAMAALQHLNRFREEIDRFLNTNESVYATRDLKKPLKTDWENLRKFPILRRQPRIDLWISDCQSHSIEIGAAHGKFSQAWEVFEGKLALGNIYQPGPIDGHINTRGEITEVFNELGESTDQLIAALQKFTDS